MVQQLWLGHTITLKTYRKEKAMPVRVSSRKRANTAKYGKAKAVSAKGKNYKAAGVGRMKKASARRRSITR